MNKEKEPKTDSGYSEKEMDLASDKMGNLNQVKARSIFDLNKNKKKEKVIIGS